ncbi:MAG: RNA polymerase factor sigma-54 [Proteobacteria bacterium]|nr:RNA polymerase factor sigma-54 [Pseudomonadota bacterium]
MSDNKNPIGFQLTQKQDVSMTAALQEAIALLQLTGPELHDMLERELGENPCLEKEEADEGAVADGREEGDWEAGESWDIRDEGYGGAGPQGRGVAGDEEGGWESRATREEGLQDFVWGQFAQVVKEGRLRAVGKYLIEGLDEAGYLRPEMLAGAVALGMDAGMVDDARAIVQTLEPAGVGARDLAECLRLQMHARGRLDEVAEVCLGRLDLVAAKDWEALAGLVNKGTRNEERGTKDWCDAGEVQLAVEDIQTCNPKPGLGFGSMKVDVVVPDVIVSRVVAVTGLEGWKVELNGAAFPRLMAVPLGAVGGKGRAAEEGRRYAGERYGRAKWLISALEQRAKTTLAVAKVMVQAQRQFLEAGKEFMLPLTLREVADKAGVHESTVSRVVAGKHMLTPHGMVAFKSFFASGVASTGGNVGVASSSVQALISKLVKAEDPKKPMSDEQIVKKLQEEGVAVARRTVAKYRGILQIPGTAERRVR